MEFRIFSNRSDETSCINEEVQAFIDEKKEGGLVFHSKTVDVVGDDRGMLTMPIVVITVWMGEPKI